MPFPAKIDPATLPDVALAVAERQGWDKWSLRDVAAELDVSPNALYRHVEDRDGLVVDMGVRAVTALTDALRAAADSIDDPVDALVAMAREYLDFAANRPAAYQAVVEAKPDEADPRRAVWHDCLRVLDEAVARVVPAPAESCTFALWSCLHGGVDLTKGPAVPNERVGDGVEATVRALLAGFAVGADRY